MSITSIWKRFRECFVFNENGGDYNPFLMMYSPLNVERFDAKSHFYLQRSFHQVKLKEVTIYIW